MTPRTPPTPAEPEGPPSPPDELADLTDEQQVELVEPTSNALDTADEGLPQPGADYVPPPADAHLGGPAEGAL
jgi:hypothetical protein